MRSLLKSSYSIRPKKRLATLWGEKSTFTCQSLYFLKPLFLVTKHILITTNQDACIPLHSWLGLSSIGSFLTLILTQMANAITTTFFLVISMHALLPLRTLTPPQTLSLHNKPTQRAFSLSLSLRSRPELSLNLSMVDNSSSSPIINHHHFTVVHPSNASNPDPI